MQKRHYKYTQAPQGIFVVDAAATAPRHLKAQHKCTQRVAGWEGQGPNQGATVPLQMTRQCTHEAKPGTAAEGPLCEAERV